MIVATVAEVGVLTGLAAAGLPTKVRILAETVILALVAGGILTVTFADPAYGNVAPHAFVHVPVTFVVPDS